MPYDRPTSWQAQIDDAHEAEALREQRGSGLYYQIQANDKALIMDDSRLLGMVIKGTPKQRAEALKELRGPGEQAGAIYICRNKCYWRSQLWKEAAIIEYNGADIPRHFELISEGPPAAEGEEIVLFTLLDPKKPGRRHRAIPTPEVERESPREV